MSKIFDENNMYNTLKPYLPKGETVIAGVHANAQEAKIVAHYKNCVALGDYIAPLTSDMVTKLLGQKVVATPGENTVLEVVKKKYCGFSVYVALTQHYLLIVPSTPQDWYYQVKNFDERPDLDTTILEKPIKSSDIGYCYPLDDLTKFTAKNVWMGAVNTTLQLKNGSYFKIQFPKRAGLGQGMPHQAEYREQILARLGEV